MCERVKAKHLDAHDVHCDPGFDVLSPPALHREKDKMILTPSFTGIRRSDERITIDLPRGQSCCSKLNRTWIDRA
jgi:hypothetical protein